MKCDGPSRTRRASSWGGILLACLLALNGARAKEATAQPGSPGERSVMEGVFTTSQARRGEQQFKQTCTSCHTVDQMTGSRFRSRWVDETVGDVFDFLINTMPGGDPGSLMPDEYASIVAFLLRQSDYPSGEKELSSVLEELKKIRIVATSK